MALTDTIVRNAKPREKPFQLTDEKGLSLWVQPSGGKWWRFRYRFCGKGNMLSLGVYPEVSLKDARDRRDESRKLVANGINPGDNRKVQKRAKAEREANSFEVVAREWFAKFSPGWAPSHANKVIRRLELYVFPWLGGKPVSEINAHEILKVLERIEKLGILETAYRAKVNCSQVFRYAVQTNRAERDPCPDLKGALGKVDKKSFPAITEPTKVAELLRAMDAFKGTYVVQSALRLAPLLFVRPGELRQARWESIDLDKAEWRYITSKTKTEHLVPLASQAVGILRELHDLSGHHEYVFPGARTALRPMSDAAVNAALRRMGYDTKTEITGHGFRAMARTILHEELHQKPEVIEHQLAHAVPDALGTAYNRTKFLKERRTMMQLWADYLDKLKAGADVIPLHGDAA
jgi:integrase